MFKKYLPYSLFGRFLLIILVPSIIVQLVAIYIFYERHWSSVSRHMELALAGDVAMIVQSISGKSDEERKELFNLVGSTLYIDAKFFEGQKLPDSQIKKLPRFDTMTSELALRVPFAHSVYYIEGGSSIAIDIQLNDGVLKIVSSRKRIANPSTYIFIMWMSGTALIVVLVSIVFMRNQVRPITRLAEAAEQLGRGIEPENFKPTGALEVRKATEAFIQMQRRINRQVEQRTEMLAGVSHDLKTPLTRIKLQLAMMKPSKIIKDLQSDIVEMEKMVQGYLDFAKGREKEPAGPVNISDLLRSIVSGYRKHHHNIDLKVQAGITISLNSNSFRRVIGNLLDNALRYGKNVEVNAVADEHEMHLTIDDDGPGISPKKRELVFKPFYRLDQSRSLETGGTGLGLSIAKDVVIGYGGDISLDTSPMGGLRVIINLPL